MWFPALFVLKKGLRYVICYSHNCKIHFTNLYWSANPLAPSGQQLRRIVFYGHLKSCVKFCVFTLRCFKVMKPFLYLIYSILLVLSYEIQVHLPTFQPNLPVRAICSLGLITNNTGCLKKV